MRARLFIKRLKPEFWVLLLAAILVCVGLYRVNIAVKRQLDRVEATPIQDVSEKVLEVESPVEGLKWQLFNVSAYCTCKYCVDKKFRDGRFANGDKVRFGGIAADKRYRFGTKIEFEKSIKGVKRFIVKDRGRVIKGSKIDLYMFSHKEAKRFGRKMLYGRIVE